MLRLQGVSTYVSGATALDDVSFEITRGEIHALVGESGAGKSTLARILSGVHTIYSGEILLDEIPLILKNPRAAQRLGIAIVHQEPGLVPHLPVAGNIHLGREPRTLVGTISHRRMHRRSTEFLRRLDLAIDPRRTVSSLRPGEQQLVAVAKALSLEPRLLILDEPTSALGSAEANRLFRLIRTLKVEGVTMVFITTRLDEVFTLADTVTVLRDGRHIATMPKRETNRRDLARLSLGREVNELFPKSASRIGNGVLHVENLGYTPPPGSPKRSFSRISFSLHEGEILGVAGLTGSGRTELLETIFGMHPRRQISGSMLLNGGGRGRNKPPRSPRAALRNGIAFVSGDRTGQSLVPVRPVSENITLSSLASLSTGGVLRARRERAVVYDAIRRLRVRAPEPRVSIDHLSAGDRQKIALARCLLTRPRILVLDEPTRGTDMTARAEISMLIAQLAARGTAILMASSDLQELVSMCDRILVLQDGKVTAALDGPATNQAEIMTAATRGNHLSAA
jgi:ABC-type sugar transport system ATPase subunit